MLCATFELAGSIDQDLQLLLGKKLLTRAQVLEMGPIRLKFGRCRPK